MSDTTNNHSGEAQSKIKRQGFSTFLSTLFGWRRAAAATSSKPQLPVDFVSVDLDSKQRLVQAALAQAVPTGKLTSKLEELFNSWLSDTSDNIQEIANRARRCDQLTYAVLNDSFIGRVVKLYADEGAQLDVQDRIISIESPDPRMTKEMYNLLNQWGITPQRVRSALEQLATYGDAFWSNKISENGVEKIIPLKQLQVSDRLEFNPVEALEKLKRQSGFSSFMDRETLIKQMLDDMGEANDFADLFDTKLFGFAIQNDLVVPPWAITHFRAGASSSEFYPFGTSPIIGTLAPFKLTASTITLQSIARVLSFPVTLYKVKTSAGADEARQFQVVNRVREEYDNIGVSPSGGNSEVFTVNTKIWMPEGLMDVDVKASQVDIGFTGDIEMYQDRVAVATGVPKGYLVQEWGGFGVSALSLTEQFKPFARAVFSLQSAFLDGLSELFRLHFAINGKFDFRTPFTLSLKYPAEEASDEKNQTRAASIELAGSVLELIKAAIGAEEDEGLPPDITRDIISKYTFLDPSDILKWTRDAKFSKTSSDKAADDEDEFSGDLESDMEADEEESAADEGSASLSLDDMDFGESKAADNSKRLREKKRRFKELTSRYSEAMDGIYFKVLKENAVGEFTRAKRHVRVSTYQEDCNSLMLNAIAKQPTAQRLTETYQSVLKQVKEDNATN